MPGNSSKSGASEAGRHFVPAALLPYGGFGDPDTPAPFWAPRPGTDPDKLAVSKMQDQFMRAVRLHLRSTDQSDEELERRLGYRRYGLTRKMNGTELMTLRDFVRVAEAVPEAIGAIGEGNAPNVLRERPAAYDTGVTASDHDAHTALQAAIHALDDAAQRLAETSPEDAGRTQPILHSIGALIADVGRSLSQKPS